MADGYSLIERLRLTLHEGINRDECAADLAKRAIAAFEERIEDWRAGIDHLAEHGSEGATRDGAILDRLLDAIREGASNGR